MRVVLGATLLLSSLSALPAAGSADPGVERVTRLLTERFSGEQPDCVSPAPVQGLYEVGIGAQVFYVSADGRYLMRGSLIDLDTREDLTEGGVATGRLKLLAAVPEDSILIFLSRGRSEIYLDHVHRY